MKIKLNLIPPDKKEEIKKAQKFRMIIRWELELTAIAAVFLTMLFSLNYILQLNLLVANNNFERISNNNNQIKKIKEYDLAIKENSVKISEIEKIQNGQLHWGIFFEKLNGTVPIDVALVSVSTKDYKIFLTGKAKNRDILVAFKENLEKNDCFLDVNLPLSNLVVKEDLAFQLDFNIKKECLKNNQ
jgi:Tfp pilus assembly protein PilN